MAGTQRSTRLVPLALVLAALAAGAALWPARAAQPATPRRPALLVLVVVDQMRAEYLTRYASLWSGGFKRLLEQGAIYDQTFYPYLNTVTCAGHATLGTGAWPKTHGIILNQWFHRDIGDVRPCTVDPSATTYTYGGASGGDGHSAVKLKVPTLGERMRRRWPQTRVVTMSMKARSAIMMAGKDATSVTWLGGNGWQTSSAFRRPRPEVARFLTAQPYTNDTNAVWERLHPAEAYTGADDGVGERPATGWTPTFPHPLSGTAKGTFKDLWEESPYSDAYLGAMAAAAIRDFRLGQRNVPDFLGVSFSATDHVGHSFGPDSHEVQDVLARLDRTLGRLLTTLDTVVGSDRYVLALSSDHGVATVPEATQAAGRPAGRVPLGAVRTAVDTALAGLGAGPHVARAEYTQVYLTREAQAKATATTMAPAIAALRAIPGIATAVWNGDLAAAHDDVAPDLLAAIRAGHVPERSGDITIVPAPDWIFVPGNHPDGGDGTTHGSPHTYDQHVPLVFLGPAFQAGHYGTRVTPADLAPTLAATIGLLMRDVEGRPLTDAVTRRTPPQ
jgi:Type I phosphodiesterase / nucleotide pyrophosphatase